MAYYQINKNAKGLLVAKIQVSGKNPDNGKAKLYVKRIYNTDNLTEAKFRKKVDLIAAEMERDVQQAYQNAETEIHTRVLTFPELMEEWKKTIRATRSINYYTKICDVEKRFNCFLKERRLIDKPITEIKVRDIQLFLNSFELYHQNGIQMRLKKDFPPNVSMRKLAEHKILDRFSSYSIRRKGAHIGIKTAKAICEFCNLDIKEYFEQVDNEKQYSPETIKGYRRVLRTLFNEAVRYEWITKNPVSATKISAAGNNNLSLRAVPEKEVFSIAESKEFLKRLDEISDEFIYKKVILKMMLLTGLRTAEMHGLRWSDIDFDKKLVYVRRNRLYSKDIGVYEKEPKTRTSTRYVPLPDSLVADLKRYYDWFKEVLDDFEENLDAYYLVVNIYREPLGIGRLGVWLTDIENKYGFKHVTCHGLRHTYCSLLLSQNVPIQTVSKYMGHSDSTVTLQVYAHFIPDTQEKVVTALNNIT